MENTIAWRTAILYNDWMPNSGSDLLVRVPLGYL